MKYLSVCSGIEAATQAWHPLGWNPWAFSQFDPDHNYRGGPDFASAVLAFHYPHVPNLGDMTKFEEWPDADIDVLVGGTPCQSYSVAGLRAGLDDPRGDLMLTYAAIARRYRTSWVVWENVPGVLSDDGGRSFGTLLGLLTGKRIEVPSGGWETAGFIEGYKSAYGIAWRILDSQFVRVDGFGRAVAQRRRRVFVVGYLGDWRRAAAVLFERSSLSGDPAPRRRAGQGSSADVAPSLVSSGRGVGRTGETRGQDPVIAEVIGALNSVGGNAYPGQTVQDAVSGMLIPEVANPLTARMFKGVNTTMDEGQTMIGEPFSLAGGARPPTIAFHGIGNGEGAADNVVPGIRGGHNAPAVAFQPRFARNGRGAPDVVAAALTGEAGRTGKGDSAQCVAVDWRVRRLTPAECERLQGFSDGYTNIPWRGKNGSPDGPRYRVLGNSMSCNVMRWLGRRIEMVDKIAK